MVPFVARWSEAVLRSQALLFWIHLKGEAIDALFFFFFFFHLRVKEAGLVVDWLISQSGGSWFEFHSDHLLNLFLIAQNSLDPLPRALVNSQPVASYRLAWGLYYEPCHVLFGWFVFSCLSGCLSTSWILNSLLVFNLYILMRVLQR